MISYNLTTENWIQAIDLNGNIRYFSLEDILINSHLIREIFLPSPIEEVSIYRFLQAFFIIFTGVIEDEEKWTVAFENKKFDTAKVKEYFEVHRRKFDLFDEQRPFYQHPDTLGAGISPMILLFQDLSSNNNACLFDHSYNRETSWIPLSRIAVGLIAQQGLVFGGGVSKPCNFRASAMSGTSVFWVKGENLYESLLLNTPYLEENEQGFMKLGKPTWEKPLINSSNKSVNDYLDYLTFQSRRLKIEPPANISEKNYNPETKEIFCSLENKGFSISRCQGDYFESPAEEPIVALRYNEKEKRYFPYKLRESRDAWRDSEILYTGYKNDVTGMAPVNLSKLKYYKADNLTSKEYYPVNIYTVNNESGQPKIVMWRRSIMPYFPQLMNEAENSNEKFAFVIDLLQKAETTSKRLYVAVFTFCKILKHPNKAIADINPSGDDLKIIKKMTEKLKPEQDYWSELTAEFYNCLEQISKLENKDKMQEVVENFGKFTFITATQVFDKSLENAGNAKAYSIARNTFNYKPKEEKENGKK
jgi:CRISPR type I-E-associated protein CasA/Cse1